MRRRVSRRPNEGCGVGVGVGPGASVGVEAEVSDHLLDVAAGDVQLGVSVGARPTEHENGVCGTSQSLGAGHGVNEVHAFALAGVVDDEDADAVTVSYRLERRHRPVVALVGVAVGIGPILDASEHVDHD
jgi:hypothetical protein